MSPQGTEENLEVRVRIAHRYRYNHVLASALLIDSLLLTRFHLVDDVVVGGRGHSAAANFQNQIVPHFLSAARVM